MHRTSEHRIKTAEKDGAPKLQKTTGLLSDQTLRAGDAVMTKDGIRIFKGKRSTTHSVEQFVGLEAAGHMTKQARAIFGQIDNAAHSDLGRERDPRSPLIGRSIAIDGQTREGLHGTIRYVGP